MLLSERIRHRLRQQGRAEGRRELARSLAAWYERQQRALERGEKFDEPPPGVKR